MWKDIQNESATIPALQSICEGKYFVCSSSTVRSSSVVKTMDLCRVIQQISLVIESLVVAGRASGQNCSHVPVKLQTWYLGTLVGIYKPLNKRANDIKFGC